MHSIQQNIHDVIKSLFYYITEIKYAVFEKNNENGLEQMNANNNDKNESKEMDKKMEKINNKFKLLTLNDIFNDNYLKLLNRILCTITLKMFFSLTEDCCESEFLRTRACCRLETLIIILYWHPFIGF